MTNNDEKMMTVKEFSAYMNIPEKTIYRLISEQKIPAYRIYGNIRICPQNFKDLGGQNE